MSKVAFVLSGGGSHGAVQVGMAWALYDAGVVPDVIFGSSVGALNGAGLAEGLSEANFASMAAVWKDLDLRSPLRVDPIWLACALVGRRNSLIPPHHFRDFLAGRYSYSRVEDARIPLHIAATELATGRERLLSSGNLIAALMASSAVPGVFPPVCLDGVHYVDGLVHGAPVRQAVLAGFNDIFLLLATPPGRRDTKQTAWGVARRAATVIMNRHLTDTAVGLPADFRLHMLPASQVSEGLSRRDFSRSQELIESGYEGAAKWVTSWAG